MTEPAIRMPAEWEPHEATWLAYPHLSSDWPGKVSAVRWAVVEFIRQLAEHERVRLLVRSAREAGRARSALRRGGADLSAVELDVCPTDRAWLRDSGPSFVLRKGRLAAACWRFNAWGRYSNWQHDRQVGRTIAGLAGAPAIEPRFRGRGFVMEGGAVDCNGRGALLATEQCLLGQGRQARNRGASRQEVEAVLSATLGASVVLWLGAGIRGDDTGGHIDNLARFVGPRKVVAAVERDSTDANYAALRSNLARLRSMRDQDGQPLEVVELPMPRPLRFDGERLPASYTNFYIANGCVLVPTFNDANDAAALGILQGCFPGRRVCGVHCVDIALGGGALHCLAQQQPQVPAGRVARAAEANQAAQECV